MEVVEDRTRSTVYLRKDLHKALQAQAKETSSSISDLINQAVQSALLEDQEDLAVCEERSQEPTISFNQMVQRLNLDGKV